MAESPARQYLAALRRNLRGGDATERTHYRALQDFIESLSPGVEAKAELSRIECGAPDFHVKKRGLLIGHIEAKDVGADLHEAEESEQIKQRYRPSLTNLILTNFLEFRWYVRGDHRKTVALGRLDSQGKIRSSAEGGQEAIALLKDFLSHKPQGAVKAKELAVSLARLAHQIRDVIVAAFQRNQTSATLRDLMEAMQKALLPDLTPEQFADVFAQTLVYGFFAAWCNHPLNRQFERYGAAADIPKTNPFLRQLFETITGTALDEEPFVGYVDDLILLLSHTDRSGIMKDFGQHTGREDPIIHFYETFLKEYDPRLRELRGVYYTPDAVVSYMVRSVDHLLRTRFACRGGLADDGMVTYTRRVPDKQPTTVEAPRVLILDPACGTGGFLYAIITHVRDQFMKQRRAGEWCSYVREQLLPRIFGFELLMAPYAVAHLKLGLQLAAQDLSDAQRKTWAYDFSGDERLGIFLTNSLEEATGKAEAILGLRALVDEANAAAEVKRGKLIMVVIGNPPYSGHSANRSWRMIEREGKGRGGRKTRREPTFIGTLLRDYYQVDGKPLDEKNPKWLQDDYVKFIRFGQWRIKETGEGILALITNHSYLDNPTFRGMRQQLMQAFTDLYLLDLHGNTKKKERAPDGGKDENVFEIQQGVAIALFVKERDGPGPARVWHADLWGLRDSKEAILAATSVHDVSWRQLQPTSPRYLFVPQDTALLPEYSRACSVADVFGVFASTVTTARNHFAMAYQREVLMDRLRDLTDPAIDDQVLRVKYDLKDVSYWNLRQARKTLSGETGLDRLVRPYCYRPFDFRFVFHHGAICERPRTEVMRHMTYANLALLTHRPQSPGDFTFAYCTRMIGDQCVAANKSAGGGNSFEFPLYLYPAVGTAITRDQQVEELKKIASAQLDQAAMSGLYALTADLFPEPEYPRWPNLHPIFVDEIRTRLSLRFLPDGSGDLKESFGPEDVFGYIYAILHCPTYRSRYAEFLKRDFPRIPLSSNRDLFAGLVAKGKELVAVHLMESHLLDTLITNYPEKGSDTVERVWYDRDKQRAYINKMQYFDGLPREVWDFFVGGYQVCEKWLKDRKGRKLDNNDLQHYQRIVVALRETIRLMAEIDALIPAWPLA
jgi:predicted helicase